MILELSRLGGRFIHCEGSGHLTLDWTLDTAHCTLHTAHCTLHTGHWTLDTLDTGH
jgi:hypothetical protein